MKRLLLPAILCICTFSVVAQDPLGEMIAAEREFAAYALAHGTKLAFLRYADSLGVMFASGEPVSAWERWQQRDNPSGVLNWRPRFAEIAASGDFGYTCGPWSFHPRSVHDSAVGTGFFFTVWQKKPEGWKFILDVGLDHAPPMTETFTQRLRYATTPGTLDSLLATEAAYTQALQSDSIAASWNYGPSALLGREGKPLLRRTAGGVRPRPAAGKIRYTLLGHGIAPSRDLAYVYGSATLNGKNESYLRIWRHEAGGWRVALEMVRF